MDKVEKAVIDLDGKWPAAAADDAYYGGREPVLLRCMIDHGEDGDLYFAGKYYDGTNLANKSVFEVICTKHEFMEARKRLENKPSWDDAPEWAEWLGNDYGVWTWFEEYPASGGDDNGKIEHVCPGHRFTDWRQSLEPRPQPDHKEGEGVEWDGEGLPPVGWAGECTWGTKEIWHKCVMLYDGEVAIYPWRALSIRIDKIADHEFRPIQSHRNKFIKAATKVMQDCYDSDGMTPSDVLSDIDRESYLGALYDAGFRLPNDKESEQ